MKEIEKDVKSKGKVVGKVKAKQYDTLAEAVKDLTEKVALVKLNSQVLTDAMNKARKPSEDVMAKLLSKAPPEAQAAIKAILEKHGMKVEAPAK
jgi:hypothetical protein